MHHKKFTTLLLSSALIAACGNSGGNSAKTPPSTAAQDANGAKTSEDPKKKNNTTGSQTDIDSKKQPSVIDESGDAPADLINSLQKEIESPIFTYLLDQPTVRYRGIVIGASSTSYSGTLSKEAKDLVREVWTKLAEKGFSGYDPNQLNKEISFSDGGWYSSPSGTGVQKRRWRKLSHTSCS